MLTPSAPGNQIHLVDATNQPSVDLLRAAYDQIYCAMINEDDREDFDTWLNNLEGNDEYVGMAVSIVGEHLDTHSAVIKGMSVGFYYKYHDTALIGYNLVDPNHENEAPALKQALLEYTTGGLEHVATANGGKIDGVFLEVDDPDRMVGKAASMEASSNLSMLESLGVRTVDIRYIPPPYGIDGEKNAQLRLMHYSTTGKPPERDTVRDFVKGIYEGLSENLRTTIEDDPDLNEMLREIYALKATTVNSITPPSGGGFKIRKP